MGLLDGITGNSWDDPKTMATLALAQGLLGGRNFSQGLLGGMQGYGATLAAAKDKERAIAQEQLKARLLDAQIGETQAQAQQRMAAIEAARQKAAEDARFSQAIASGAITSPQQALTGGGGPTVQNAQQIGQARIPDWQQLLLQNPQRAKEIEELMKVSAGARDFGKPEVAGTLEGTTATGLPASIMRDKFGNPIGNPVPKAVEMKLANLGGVEQAYNPFALTPGQTFQRTVDPNTMFTGNITMRGQNMTDARAREQNQISAGNNLTEGESKLRKEFEGLPEVKNYKQAYPSYAGIVDASKRSTPMADINIVYGLAKLYDPTSVVREGEYATVANAPNIPERIKGWAQYVSGGGKLTEEVKAQILQEAQSRINSYAGEFNKARNSYEGMASRYGMNASNIFAGVGDAVSGPANIEQPSKPSGKPQPGEVRKGYRFKGGDPADQNNWERL